MRATGGYPCPNPIQLYQVEKAKRPTFVIAPRQERPDPHRVKSKDHEQAKRVQERGGWDWRQSVARGRRAHDA